MSGNRITCPGLLGNARFAHEQYQWFLSPQSPAVGGWARRLRASQPLSKGASRFPRALWTAHRAPRNSKELVATGLRTDRFQSVHA